MALGVDGLHGLWIVPARALVATWAALAGVAAGSAAAAPPHQVPDTMAQRVEACTACHGPEGVATNHGYFPRIAGKPAGYLYQQLLNFRDGRRSNAAMSRLIEPLSDAYLKEIATHFATLDLPYPPPPARAAAAEELRRGEKLVRHGDAARSIPACVQCHGEAMTGVLPATPGLLGLPRDYLLAQLGAWRSGQRHAVAPDCMGDISRGLSDAEVSAVATWLSLQPVPRDAKPALRLPAPPPVDCGSLR